MNAGLPARTLLTWYLVVPALVVATVVGAYAGWNRLASGSDSSPVLDPYGNVVYAPEIDQTQAVWWMWLGDGSAAVANLGPLFESESGYTVRRWTLTVHSDGPEPLHCFQGILNVDGSTPLELNASTYSVRLQPHKGLTWRDVEHESHVRGDLSGL